jgi:UDP-N-acetylglucosamine 1-carboxyvinyltransferase
MGASILEDDGRYRMTLDGSFHGADLSIGYPSVGATCTFLLAAATASSTSSLHNAAREPEVRIGARTEDPMGHMLSSAREVCR